MSDGREAIESLEEDVWTRLHTLADGLPGAGHTRTMDPDHGREASGHGR